MELKCKQNGINKDPSNTTLPVEKQELLNKEGENKVKILTKQNKIDLIRLTVEKRLLSNAAKTNFYFKYDISKCT